MKKSIWVFIVPILGLGLALFVSIVYADVIVDAPYQSPYLQFVFQIRDVEDDAVPLSCGSTGCHYPAFWLPMNPGHVGDEVELYTSFTDERESCDRLDVYDYRDECKNELQGIFLIKDENEHTVAIIINRYYNFTHHDSWSFEFSGSSMWNNWTPEYASEYTIEVFVWQGFENPTPLLYDIRNDTYEVEPKRGPYKFKVVD